MMVVDDDGKELFTMGLRPGGKIHIPDLDQGHHYTV
jgi:hypothetical protein